MHRIGARRAIGHPPTLHLLGVKIGTEQLPRRGEDHPRCAVHPFGLLTRVQLSSSSLASPSKRSEEHTSELQSLMRISYAVFCLKKKKKDIKHKLQHINKITIITHKQQA